MPRGCSGESTPRRSERLKRMCRIDYNRMDLDGVRSLRAGVKRVEISGDLRKASNFNNVAFDDSSTESTCAAGTLQKKNTICLTPRCARRRQNSRLSKSAVEKTDFENDSVIDDVESLDPWKVQIKRRLQV